MTEGNPITVANLSPSNLRTWNGILHHGKFKEDFRISISIV